MATYFDDSVGSPRQLHRHDSDLVGLPQTLAELLAHLTEDGQDALLEEIREAASTGDKGQLASVLKALLRSYAFARDAGASRRLVERFESAPDASDPGQAYTLDEALATQ